MAGPPEFIARQAYGLLAAADKIMLASSLGFGDPATADGDAVTINRAACAVLSDPRAVLIAPGSLFRLRSMIQMRAFDVLGSAFPECKAQLRLLRLVADISKPFQISSESLKEEQRLSRHSYEYEEYGDVALYEPECVVLEQLKSFKGVADRALGRDPWLTFGVRDDDENEGDDKYLAGMGSALGPGLARHPSVRFLVAVCLYKAGSQLHTAWELLGYVPQRHPLLGPTCNVLRALCKFWAGNSGSFNVLNIPQQRSRHCPPQPDVNRSVLAELRQAAAASEQLPPNSPKAVPDALLVDLHAAAALLCLFDHCGDGGVDRTAAAATEEVDSAGTIEAKEHFVRACSHFSLLLSTDGTGIMGGGTNVPLLLFRASFLLDLDLPEGSPSHNLQAHRKMVQAVEQTWERCPMHVPKEIALWKAGLPVTFDSQLGPWDSCAAKLQSQGRGGHHVWWTAPSSESEASAAAAAGAGNEATATGGQAAVSQVCAVCGGPRAGEGGLKVCSACKEVSYCSRDCQKMDWAVLHKKICRLLR